ncbi:alpha/beta hydrolase [Streptomyces sp. Ru73]|uniref:alpha/beta hydrolase n=1 Tax=Streptomyces sp. Ru73 TaxID=2080748 RepID=UPI000CDDC19E|nr:alpha/beta hydrolase [Streptomyces sp. Ru73]POX36796.1 alpha/beta hydrolase [Streptomyces sp. Ru73]
MPLHPAIAAKLHLLEGLPGPLDGPLTPAQQARLERFLDTPGGPPPAADAVPLTLPGRHGAIPARVYSRPGPEPATGRCFVWVHGGGWVTGDLDMPEADRTAREIAARSGATVVSIDYRKAVDGVAHPVPLDDVADALAWIRDHRRETGGGTGTGEGPLSVGGASAGANLAAGAVLRLRDATGWTPAHVVLVYPALHAVLPAPSARLSGMMAGIPRAARLVDDYPRVFAQYLGGPPDTADGYAAPALADLSGFPPTTVLNAEYDDLRPSGEAFTAALAVAGTDVTQVLVRGTLHGFLTRPGTEEPTDHALDVMAQHLTTDRTP